MMRYDWLVDISPAGDIHRRDVVGETRESADHAGENTLTRTIGLIDTPAARTGSTSISGVNQKYRNPFSSGFVFDKGAKLKERPAMQYGSLAATNRNPRADALQIFQSNRPLCVFRLRHDLFADAVVGVFRKAFFLSGKPPEFPSRRTRAFALQLGAQLAVSITDVVDVTGRVDFPIAVHSDIRYPQVNPQNSFRFSQGRFLHFADCRKKELVTKQDQVRLSLPRIQQFALTLAAHEGDAQSPGNRPDRNSRVLQSPRKDAVIIGNTTVLPECALLVPVKFVSMGNLGNYAYSNLGRQTKPAANILVAQMMQVELSEYPGFPCLLADELAGSIGRFDCSQESSGLFRGEHELDLRNQFHVLYFSANVLIFQGLKLHLLTLFNYLIQKGGAASSAC